MTTTNLITRKGIAELIDPAVTVDQVRRNEKRWGLDKARADLNCRCVRYRRMLVVAILKKKGFVE